MANPKWRKRAWELHQRNILLGNRTDRLTSEAEVINFLTLALCGEAGELANLAKKMWVGRSVPTQSIKEEIADIRIYLELLAAHHGVNIDAECDQKLDVFESRLVDRESGRGDTPS